MRAIKAKTFNNGSFSVSVSVEYRGKNLRKRYPRDWYVGQEEHIRASVEAFTKEHELAGPWVGAELDGGNYVFVRIDRTRHRYVDLA